MKEMSPKPATVYPIVLVHLSGLSQLSACKIRMTTKWKPVKRGFQKPLEALLGGNYLFLNSKMLGKKVFYHVGKMTRCPLKYLKDLRLDRF